MNSPDRSLTHQQAFEAWKEAERRAEESQRETQRLRLLAHQALRDLLAANAQTSAELRWNPRRGPAGRR
jgi:hypothetical protein